MNDYGDSIAEWTTNELTRFVQQLIAGDENVNSPNKTIEELTVSRKAIINDELQFLQTQTTVGSAGAASAPPATPELYAKVVGPDGQVRLIPLYKIA